MSSSKLAIVLAVDLGDDVAADDVLLALHGRRLRSPPLRPALAAGLSGDDLLDQRAALAPRARTCVATSLVIVCPATPSHAYSTSPVFLSWSMTRTAVLIGTAKPEAVVAARPARRSAR